MGNEIVGGFFYKLYGPPGKQVGYNSLFFIDIKHQGKGIGRKLFAQGVYQLRSLECSALVSYVLDDNVGSWGNFLNNGFSRVPFLSITPYVGLFQAVKLYIATFFGVAIGCDFYLSVKDKELSHKEPKSFGQIVAYLLVNAVLFMPIFLSTQSLPLSLLAFFGIFAGIVISSYIGTLFSKCDWRFRFNNGGLLVCGLFTIFHTFVPMGASWFPKTYENTPQFRRDLAMPALFSWVFLIAVGFAAATVFPFLARLVQVLLIFRCMIVIETFKTYGGQRVYNWNKSIFMVLTAISLTLAFVVI